MKTLLALLFIVLYHVSIGQNRYHIYETNVYQNLDTIVLNTTSERVTGVVYETHENGRLETEANFKNGQQDGLTKIWFENGQLRGEGNFKSGKPDGATKIWYESGQLKTEKTFKDGKLVSQKCFDQRGDEMKCRT
jgi:antitoxin component YwqK of YwqJK toxin-antitoxin module